MRRVMYVVIEIANELEEFVMDTSSFVGIWAAYIQLRAMRKVLIPFLPTWQDWKCDLHGHTNTNPFKEMAMSLCKEIANKEDYLDSLYWDLEMDDISNGFDEEPDGVLPPSQQFNKSNKRIGDDKLFLSERHWVFMSRNETRGLKKSSRRALRRQGKEIIREQLS